MERHFLYLPLYLAQFDHPKSHKLSFFGKVPRNYKIRIAVPKREKDRTDAWVFGTLMDSRLASSDIMFAVCDPTTILARKSDDALMAASLISSSAFWAVNHDAKDVSLVSDLSSFDRILCYKEKTTSNLIARRIAKQRGKQKIKIVPPTEEIRALEEYGEGTLAISPEVLKIANLINGPLRNGESRAAIVLELSTTKEFSNVLTTALLTRAEVVEKHPDLVRGVLVALQKSLLAIYARHPMVAECARHNYQDTFALEEALEIARNGNVFPETIQVRHDRWQRACEFYYISHALAEGKVKRALTKEELLKTEALYRQAAQDPRLRRLVSEAIACGFSESLEADASETSVDGSRWLKRLRATIWTSGLLAVGFAAGHVIAATINPAAKIAVGASWVVLLFAGWLSGEVSRYRKPSAGYAVHWFAFTLLWWALHELLVPRVVENGHFIAGIEIRDGLAGGVLTIAGSYVIGVGIYVRSQGRGEKG